MNKEPIWLTSNDIMLIRNDIPNKPEIYGDSFLNTKITNTNTNNMESVLNNPKNIYYYNNEQDIFKLASSYGIGFAKRHCFSDGNKRTTLIVIYIFLYVNGYKLTTPSGMLYPVIIDIASGAMNEEQLAEYLKLNSEIVKN